MKPAKTILAALTVVAAVLALAAPGAAARADEAAQPAAAAPSSAAVQVQPASIVEPAAQVEASEAEAVAFSHPDQMRDVPKGLHLGGYGWTDLGAMNRTLPAPGQYNYAGNYMNGRLVVRGSFYKEVDDFFGYARFELAALASEYAKGQYEPHTQDAYLQVGQRWWDVQLGRFLAWEIYHRGQGMELWTPEEAGAGGGAPTMYWTDAVRGYSNEVGQFAAHLYPAAFLGFEFAGMYGQQMSQNELGLRPAVDLQFGGLRLVGGYEYLDQLPQTEADKVKVKTRGYGGRVEYRLGLNGQAFGEGQVFPRGEDPLNRPERDAITVGFNAAHESVNALDINGLEDGGKTFTKSSIGGYVDVDFWRNAIGFGLHRTIAKTKAGADSSQNQLFITYLFRLPVENLFVKVVYGWATAPIEDVDAKTSFRNGMSSYRLRLAYDFR